VWSRCRHGSPSCSGLRRSWTRADREMRRSSRRGSRPKGRRSSRRGSRPNYKDAHLDDSSDGDAADALSPLERAQAQALGEQSKREEEAAKRRAAKRRASKLTRELYDASGQLAEANARLAKRNKSAKRKDEKLKAAEKELEDRRTQELLVKGEIVEIAPDVPNPLWYALRPAVLRVDETYPPPGSSEVDGVGLLDTGNGAVTMINPLTAAEAGIQAHPHRYKMVYGITGHPDKVPVAEVRIKIRGFELAIEAAIGSPAICGVLVGEDILDPMFEAGYSISGFRGIRDHAGRVQWRGVAAGNSAQGSPL